MSSSESVKELDEKVHMSEMQSPKQNSEVSEGTDISEEFSYISNSEEFAEISEMETVRPNSEMMKNETKSTHKVLSADHPLMIKYQRDLKERLLKLLQETDEKLLDMERTIAGQEVEHKHFAERGYEMQKELVYQEEKLKNIHEKYEKQVNEKTKLEVKCSEVKQTFKAVEEAEETERKKDLELQEKLEAVAFEVVQLTALQTETFTDAKSLQRAVEKTTKDRENLEVQKLRQDFLISRLENDKFNLEDKINLYKTQWCIKKEEVADLRKDLNAANSEMETIHYEKQQIVHQWKQSLASLQKQDRLLSEIRDSVRTFEDKTATLNMDITACKKSVRKEFERNEQLILQLQFRESDIARVQKDLKDAIERENDLEENITVLDKTVEIIEQELKLLSDNKILREKDLDAEERKIQNACNEQKSLEQKHMDMLHEKMTITKASKYTEKLIKDIRNSIRLDEDKGSKKENEKEKLLLKLDNLRTYVNNLENDLEDLDRERNEKEVLLDKSETNVLKTREKLDSKRGELRLLQAELREMIAQAGGQELTPFERELGNLRKEIAIAEQGKRNMEQEYLRYQQELFSVSKQSSVKFEENDFYHKKIAVLEGKKLQLEADITKEEKEMKDVLNRIQVLRSEIAHVSNILYERNEVQENLLQEAAVSKSDYLKILKEAELNYLKKQSELKLLRRQKRHKFQKLMDAQKQIVFWEGKIHLIEETRKVLRSEQNVMEFSSLRNEIRRLQVRQEQIRKEQERLSQELERAAYRHTSLYIEADKQLLFGKRQRTPEYVLKRIKYAQKKIQEDKKELENCNKQMESLKQKELELNDACISEKSASEEMINRIRAMEYDIDNKEQEKRQDVIKLSFKQKKAKYMQKVLDDTYIRAVRNEMRRAEEIEKLQTSINAAQVITQATINEYPNLEKALNKVMDYIIVSKQI